MAEKKFSIADKVFLIVLLCGLLAIFGCASAPKVTTAPKVYYCPSGHSIPFENINTNIRMENICPSCRKSFFYTPVVESSKAENYQRGYGNYGPRNYGPTSVYQLDVNYQRFGVGGYSFKETSYGFSELSWYFEDNNIKSFRKTSYWRTTRYRLRRR